MERMRQRASIVFQLLMLLPVAAEASLLASLVPCSLGSLDLTKEESVEPCVIQDVNPSDGAANMNATTVVIPLVQVTPTQCANQRDGAVTGVKSVNTGRGVPIGYDQNTFVKFRLVSVVAGSNLEEGYNERHESLLRGLVEELQAPYIVGTCSMHASIEKQVAKDLQVILMAQVGPPSFYKDNPNPWTFGIHINSDTYPLANVRALNFWAAQNDPTRQVPIRVVYRQESEFFRSTCQSAIQAAKEAGFTNIEVVVMDPTGDDNNNSIANEVDPQTIQLAADKVCPPNFPDHPALFVCTIVEQEALLDRWRQNYCQPRSLWLTAATWGWAQDNQQFLPYLQGGGQWHPAMDYSDHYFNSGQELLEHNAEIYGYNGTYDQVVSYVVPVLFSQHLQHVYRVQTDPNPMQDLAAPEGRERLRRFMMTLNVDSIFGKVAFDENQRNVGRPSAGTQWLPYQNGEFKRRQLNSTMFANALISPLLQAEAAIVLPAPTAELCTEGLFLNRTLQHSSPALLQSSCEPCHIDTIADTRSQSCTVCEKGSSTKGRFGQNECIPDEEFNFIDQELLLVGSILFGMIVFLCLISAIWLFLNKNHVLVRISQPLLLGMVILGCLVSGSSILFLGAQAEYATDVVDAACMLSPWLYGVGFAVIYGPLLAKLLRIMLVTRNAKLEDADKGKSRTSKGKSRTPMSAASEGKQRKAVGLREVSLLVGMILAVEVAILTAWQLDSPSQWTRETISEMDGFVTESVGSCYSDGQYAYFGALAGFQLLCLTGALFLSYKTRNIHSDFAESGCISLAVAFTFQVALLSLPIFAVARDNSNVFYLVRVGAVFLPNVAVQVLLFLPKALRVRENTRDLSRGISSKKNSIYLPMASVTGSKWDVAIDSLTRMLDEDGDIFNRIPKEQREELEQVKLVLLAGDTGNKQNKLFGLPKGLTKSVFGSQGKIKNKSGKRSSQLYILQEYAGIDLKSQLIASGRFASGVETETKEADSDEVYLLPEFEALTQECKNKVAEMLSWSTLKRWDFDIFELDELSGGNPLLLIGWAVLASPHSQYAMAKACGKDVALDDLEGYNFCDSHLMIPQRTLCNYLRVIQEDYCDNPYHCATHAADVTQSLHALLQMSVDCLGASNTERFAILLSAVIHDVQHPGENNAFQTHARTELALTYNDNSILENKHVAHAFKKMFGQQNLNLLCNVDPSRLADIRSKVIKAVLHTDMSLHFKTVGEIKTSIVNPGCLLDDEVRWEALMFVLHMADISNCAKHRGLHIKWTDRVIDEFFTQGDKEEQLGLPISPNCDRNTTKKPDSQIGFIKFVIKPAYDVLGGVIPEVAKSVVPIISDNLEYWVDEKKRSGDDGSESQLSLTSLSQESSDPC